MPLTHEPSTAPAPWKVYKDDSLSFTYPNDWEVAPVQVFGSRSEVDFTFNKTTTLALSYVGNYNNGTGRPYTSLSEFLGPLSSKAKNITVEGRAGLRVADPGEAGHVVSFEQAVFFSSDEQMIINFYYQSGYYEGAQADQVLDEVLKSLKFTK